MKNFAPLFLFSLFLSTGLFSQNQSSFFVQARIGQTGNTNNVTPTYESFETTHQIEKGVTWAAGIGYQYYPFQNRNWGLKSTLLFEQAQFSRTESYQFQQFNGTNRSGDIHRDFTNVSLLNPLQFFSQFGKFGFSAGVIANFHIKNKFDEEHIFYLEGVENGRSQREFESGTYLEFPFGDWEQTEMENRLSFQWVIGAFFNISPRWSIDLEYKNHFGNNQLVQEISNYDVIGTFFDQYDVLSQTVSLGLNWRLR